MRRRPYANRRPYDIAFGKICAWLKANRKEAHTDRHGGTIVERRRPKRSRLTGEIR